MVVIEKCGEFEYVAKRNGVIKLFSVSENIDRKLRLH